MLVLAYLVQVQPMYVKLGGILNDNSVMHLKLHNTILEKFRFIFYLSVIY
jgi:hypothetical protein